MDSKVVLSVGQCGADDARIVRRLGEIGLEVERAGSMEEAARKMAGKKYDLILVNRVFDETGESGLAFISACKVKEGIVTRTMLVSDLPEAQARAVVAGARPGFGKSRLGEEETLKWILTAAGE